MSRNIGVIGAGSMGSGIAQIAAVQGFNVFFYDKHENTLNESIKGIERMIKKLADKEKISQDNAESSIKRLYPKTNLKEFASCEFVIEAIIEDLNIKKGLFKELEQIVDVKCILASNTSSLSIASIASACDNPERVIGVHFFNPAPLMPLVEIIPAVLTSEEILKETRKLIDGWGKTTVLAKDTPGFIVNRVARPFYGEALRIYEEGIADYATIDWAMKEIGGFRMGPFELMDYIGNDINYTVTETVFESFFYDPRYKPSFTQKRMSEAGLLGRKSGRGYYQYGEGAPKVEPLKDQELARTIVNRILCMLINEAVDALYLRIANKDDLELAMTKGVNYPKGLLSWAEEIGIEECHNRLLNLQSDYGEERYRPSILFKKMIKSNQRKF